MYLLNLRGLAGVLLVGVCESVVVAVAGVGLVGGVHEATCRTSSEKRERERRIRGKECLDSGGKRRRSVSGGKTVRASIEYSVILN